MALETYAKMPKRIDKPTQNKSASFIWYTICSLSSTEVEWYQYQTKKTPKAIGSTVFKVFFKGVVKKSV